MQEIITYLIISVACVFVLLSLYRTLFPPSKSSGHGCSSGCNCDAKIMRKDLLGKKKIF